MSIGVEGDQVSLAKSPIFNLFRTVSNKYNMEDTTTTSEQIVDSGQITAHAPKAKTGNKPKELVWVEVSGYEVGRGKTKKVVFDQDVYKLAALGCTDKEIATWFDIEYSTLRYNFSEIIAKGREELKHSLRRAMLRNAINNNNAALQIFLAKNMLGMSDNPIDNESNQPLPWDDEV